MFRFLSNWVIVKRKNLHYNINYSCIIMLCVIYVIDEINIREFLVQSKSEKWGFVTHVTYSQHLLLKYTYVIYYNHKTHLINIHATWCQVCEVFSL